MTAAVSSETAVSEDKLIDALRGCQDLQQLLNLRTKLALDPVNPPLFDWVCALLTDRRISRGLAARVLMQLHHHPNA